jgi:hypothetical protein
MKKMICHGWKVPSDRMLTESVFLIRCATNPPVISVTPAPMPAPIRYRLIGNVRRSGGKWSAMIEARMRSVRQTWSHAPPDDARCWDSPLSIE